MQSVTNLLNPISDARPTGEDLCFSGDFDAIANARRYDDASLDQGEWVTELKEADWEFVVSHTRALLHSRTKDMRLAVWFAEASAKSKNFKGLAEGYTLIAGLCDHYWDTLHPLAEDGDQEQRIGNLAWILSRSIQLVREMPLTEGNDTGFSLADFESARLRTLQTEKAIADGTPPPAGTTLADVESARRKSSRAFMETLIQDVKICRDSLHLLEKAVNRRLESDGPGFSNTHRALEEVIAAIQRFAPELGSTYLAGRPIPLLDLPDNTGLAHITTPNTDVVARFGGKNASQSVVQGVIQSRDQALAQLRDVARYFRQHEPHSPVAYLAEKAANWGEVPLHIWLKSVIKDGASLAHVEELLGVTGEEKNEA